MKRRNKIKPGKVIVGILIVIGTLTVIDNGYRLFRNIGSTVMNHRWNMVVVK